MPYSVTEHRFSISKWFALLLCYRAYPKHDSAQIVTVKINSYHQHIEEIRKWYNTQHMNYDLIKVEKSKWWVWNEALEIAKNSVKAIQVS